MPIYNKESPEINCVRVFAQIFMFYCVNKTVFNRSILDEIHLTQNFKMTLIYRYCVQINPLTLARPIIKETVFDLSLNTKVYTSNNQITTSFQLF